TKCIQACPVDAIVGANKLMHTVVTDLCTGCDLCVEPCPVDCIYMIPEETTVASWHWPQPGDQTADAAPGQDPPEAVNS
ncbi:MAG: RnfABCDGE type electron transport complex subunit B, partial [Gammaproteobacteria bacterium]